MANQQEAGFDDLIADFEVSEMAQQSNENVNQLINDKNIFSMGKSDIISNHQSETKAHVLDAKRIENNDSSSENTQLPKQTLMLIPVNNEILTPNSCSTDETSKTCSNVPTSLSNSISFTLQSTMSHSVKNNKFLPKPSPVLSKSILSTSMGSMPSTMNHNLLLNRVLPPYKAPLPPPPNLNISDKGYHCLECNDIFCLEASLIDHLQRQSMLILINCEFCKKTLTFYNRCRLLEHYRYHKNLNQNMEFGKCIISSLAQDSVISNILGSSINIESVDRIIDITSKETKNRNQCSECNLAFESSRDLENHFGRGQIFAVSSNSCKKCLLMCPTKCSLKAHQRIHSHAFPYVCPECGQTINDHWVVFQRHLRNKCLHFSRSIGYKCTICFVMYYNMALLRSHILNTHSESYFKCQGCPMAFKVISNFETHNKQNHGEGTSHKPIYKCPMCDTVFNLNEQLNIHLDRHLCELSKSCLYMFKCLECYKLLENKALLADHLRTSHPQSFLKAMCSICGDVFQSPKTLFTHQQTVHHLPCKLPKKRRLPIKCNDCSLFFPSASSLATHKNYHIFKCGACSEIHENKSKLFEHGKSHLELGIFVCLICSNRVLSSRKSLTKHLMMHSADAQNGKPCPHCESTFDDSKEMLKHLKSFHFLPIYSCTKCDHKFDSIKGRNKHLHNYHEKQKQRYACWLCKDKDFSKRILLIRHITTVHKIPADEIDYSKLYQNTKRIPKCRLISSNEVVKKSNDSILPVTSKKLRIDGESLYHCVKCLFTSETQSLFQNHILQHKSNKNAIQCQECGACFVTVLALKKHLFISHKIKNNKHNNAEESNSSKDGLSDSLSDSHEVNGVSNSNPLECTVCYRSFDSEVSIKTHMRTHGMAFIRSKRYSTPVEHSINS